MIELAGLLGITAVIACAILIYHATQQNARIQRLEDSVRGIGLRLGVPSQELPHPALQVEEYAPDATVDEESVNKEWDVPRGWKRWDS